MCAAEGVHLVFAPSAAEMYPSGKPEVTADAGPMGRVLEGQFRPGFFEGVLTVVLKLLHLTRPDTVVFGEKDAQQLALVRRMVSDTDLNVAVASVPTARDADGLAISSRNQYLSAAERAVALALPRALRAGQALAAEGAVAPCSPPPSGSCSPNLPWPSTISRWSTRARSPRSSPVTPGPPCSWRRPGRAAPG